MILQIVFYRSKVVLVKCVVEIHIKVRGRTKMRARERERGGEEKRDGFFPLSSSS